MPQQFEQAMRNRFKSANAGERINIYASELYDHEEEDWFSPDTDFEEVYRENMSICFDYINQINYSLSDENSKPLYRSILYSEIIDPFQKIFWTATERRWIYRAFFLLLSSNGEKDFQYNSNKAIYEAESINPNTFRLPESTSWISFPMNDKFKEALEFSRKFSQLSTFYDYFSHVNKATREEAHLIDLFEDVIKSNNDLVAFNEKHTTPKENAKEQKEIDKQRKNLIQNEQDCFCRFCEELQNFSHGILTYSLKQNKDERATTLVDYLANSGLFRSTKQYLYFYEQEYGYYRCLSTPKAEEEAVLNLFPENQQFIISSQVLREVIFRLSRVSSIRVNDDFFNDDENGRYVNCLNCVYDLKEGEPIYGNREQYHFNYCNNANYVEQFEYAHSEIIPIRKRPETFYRYIETSLGYDGAEDFLLQIIGNLCCPSMKTKNAFFFVGEPNSGKTKIGNLIKDIIGENSVSGIALHDLGDRFSNSQLSSARLNMNMEMSSKPLRNIAAFKTITGGDYAKGENKMEALYSFTHHCKLLFAGNRMPEPKDADISEAFIDRIAVLYFPHSIPREKWDPQLDEKLLAEKDDIFTFALFEAEALYKKNILNYKKLQPEVCKKFLADYENKTTKVPRFLSTCCDRTDDPYDFTSTDELFDAYLEFYKLNDLQNQKKAFEKRKFSESMAKLLGYKSKNGKDKNGNIVKGYTGVLLREEYKINTPDTSKEINKSSKNQSDAPYWIRKKFQK